MPALMLAEKIDLAPQRSPVCEPAAVIDIGSNSVRLVVYRVGSRAPQTLFNEKVMAGLGAGLADRGTLDPAASRAAREAIRRFALIARAMGARHPRAVATAAVRQAHNGGAFVAEIAAESGLSIEILSGADEAHASAMGVVSAIPAADGVVGDLGGGSLELIRVRDGKASERASAPVGSLKLIAAAEAGPRALTTLLDEALAPFDWISSARGLPFYTVGGSWRALAHLDMALTDYPLPVIHHYVMAPDAPARLARALAVMTPKALRSVPGLGKERIPALPGAAAMLGAVTARAGSSSIVASAFGLREGLLYQELPAAIRAEDPLLAAVSAEAARSSRFPETGPVIARWIGTLFASDAAPLARIRHAAALLSDIGWSANPDFRGLRAVDVALHGPWVAITLPERAILAAALHACFGGDGEAQPEGRDRWRTLAHPADLERARAWGLALRLGQRLGGGTTDPLRRSSLVRDGECVRIDLPPDLAGLMAPPVRRRLKALADAMGLRAAR